VLTRHSTLDVYELGSMMSSMSEPRTAGGDEPLLPRRVPPEVALRIGPYYVYVLIDPRDDQIFYVGKGTGDRPSSHDREAAARLTAEPDKSKRKTERIRDITATGLTPLIDIVRHGIETEDEAFQIEAALIDCLRPNITNIDAGHGREAGRHHHKATAELKVKLAGGNQSVYRLSLS
jgi:hypothetical protein